MIKSNFHTHCNYCDGKDSIRDMLESAVSKGFTRLGFSSHAHSEIEDYSMSVENQKKYRTEINNLKEEFKGKIEILCGLEKDLYADSNMEGFDYCIASVHYLYKGGKYLSVDESAEEERYNVETYYNNDFCLYAKDYYSSVLQAVKKHKADIIGHLDLLMKFSNINKREETEEYLSIAEDCIIELCKTGALFEINTGAMARGYKDIPYPSEKLLKMINKHGGKICICSDCHDKEKLDFGFDKAITLAQKCGFKEHFVISNNGVKINEKLSQN